MASAQFENQTDKIAEQTGNGGIFGSERLDKVSQDLHKAANVIATRAQELVKRENIERAVTGARDAVRRHPLETALIATGVVALAAGAIYALNRRSVGIED